MLRTRIIHLLLLCTAAYGLLIPTAAAQESRQRNGSDIDPALQGVWMICRTSNDKGQTLKKVDPFIFCRVTATEVSFSNGDKLTVQTVVTTPDQDGFPSRRVTFAGNTVWEISARQSEGLTVVRVVSPDRGFEETFRFLVAVRR